jgi:hypothetical protein
MIVWLSNCYYHLSLCHSLQRSIILVNIVEVSFKDVMVFYSDGFI